MPKQLFAVLAVLLLCGTEAIAAEGVVVRRDLVYAVVPSAGDQVLELMVDLHMPAAPVTKPPLIVWIHGGGWRKGSRKQNRLAWLAAKGFAVASIDYRLSHEAIWPAQIHDCKAAVRWLRDNAKRLGYDATRIGVGGSSAGGHLAALLGTSGGVAALEGQVGKPSRASSRVQAVYDMFGPAELLSMGGAGRARGALGQLFGAAPSRLPEIVRQASPVQHVTKDDPPFLIAHGGRDRLVPPAQSQTLHRLLAAANVPSTLREFARAGHGGREFAQQSHQDEVEAFFRKHLMATAPRATTSSVLARFSKAGRFAVGSAPEIVLRDETRKKDLRVRVTYPQGRGAFPVLVWSHGALGSKDGYLPLANHWASHGYVVIQPTHFDSLSLRKRGGRSLQGLFAGYADRPKDVTFLLDNLAVVRQRLTGFKGSIRTDQIGVGGHSFGAHTAQLIGGATTVGVAGKRLSFTDARAKAVLLISPQGRGGELDADSWQALTTPAMIVTGTLDTGRKGQPYTWRLDPYERSPAGRKHLVVVEGARHGFGGISGVRALRRKSPPNEAHVGAVKAVSLLFLQGYVRGDEAALALLTPERITRESRGAVRVSAR